MLDFQQKWKVKSFLYSRPVRIVLICVVLYSFFSTFRVYQKKVESEREVEKTEQQLLSLSEKERTLDTSIANLETPEGLEAEIRQKYSVAKGGEDMAIIIDDSSTTASHSISSLTLWQRILNFFNF